MMPYYVWPVLCPNCRADRTADVRDGGMRVILALLEGLDPPRLTRVRWCQVTVTSPTRSRLILAVPTLQLLHPQRQGGVPCHRRRKVHWCRRRGVRHGSTLRFEGSVTGQGTRVLRVWHWWQWRVALVCILPCTVSALQPMHPLLDRLITIATAGDELGMLKTSAKFTRLVALESSPTSLPHRSGRFPRQPKRVTAKSAPRHQPLSQLSPLLQQSQQRMADFHLLPQ